MAATTQVRAQVILSAVGVVLSSAVGLVTNQVTDRKSWALWLAFFALVFAQMAAVAGATLLSQPAEDERPPRQRSARRSIVTRIMLGVAIAGLAGVFAVILSAPRAEATSCENFADPRIADLQYRCHLTGWSARLAEEVVPVYGRANNSDDPIDHLFKRTGDGNLQGFACEIKAASTSQAPGFEAESSHWALTVGDEHGTWGFVPEYYFQNGASGRSDNLLPGCRPGQVKLATSPAARN